MKKNVEEIYQKKSQIEHILIRPDTYIGATNPDLQPMFVWDDSAGAIVKKNISFSPGLYKIFDEILVNAADNKERDARMTEIRIGLDRVLNRITIFNDGSGIPILIHKVENIYIPSLIFGHLLTSSNFDDSERKVVGGRNGFGAKLCNIFSHKFILETGSKSDHKSFEQIWENNMSTAHAPKINEHYHGKDFTRITFYPDLKRFNMTEFDEDFIGLVKRRAVDLAGTTKNIKVFYNDILIKINNFEQYSKLYINKNNINNFIADNNDNFDNKLKSAKIVNKNNNLDNISNNNINIDNFNNNVKNNNLNIDKNNDNFNSNKDSFNFDKFNDNDTKYFYSKVNDRWEIVVCPSDGSFQHISFVNSIATTKGGTHVNHVTNKITARLIEDAQKKIKNNKIILRQPQIKQHFWIFINCKIENPSFDSQTKENLTLNEKEFGSSCDISDKFMKKISDCLIENVISFINIKLKNELSKKGATVKRAKLHGLAKLDDANDAGTAKSRDCTLILTEGDSAKSLAVAGVAVVGRDKFGVFPLRGKVLNIRDVPVTTVIKNKEVENLVKIIGLDYKKKYEDISQLSSLRYGKVMFMTDQDFDGSHIKGLLINFFHFLWPNLIKNNFLEQFITPIVKVRKGSNVLSFYSIPEYEEWKKNTSDYKSYKIKYYKGLGTSSSIEAREYFEDLNRHRIRFKYSGQDCDDAINLAFSKNKSDSRKLWLDRFQEESSRRKEFGLPDVYLYHKDTSIVTYSDFVNKELILFSHSDNIRSIPSMIDGLKPGQRKVIFTALKKKIKDIKVFQLAGAVSEVSAYHHGETSLISTIINLAQNFVGSNNINLLNPDGQFGTRIKGGKDASAARYISTGLNFITRHIFLASDDPILNYLYEDNQLIEPDFYFPVIPMVLVNGADGIGTGYSTKIPCYDPRQIIYNLKLMLNNEEPQKMVPWFKNFTGQITEISSDKVLVTGRAYHAGQDSVVVSELPIRVWTETYKESVLEPLVKVDNSSENYVLADYKDYHDESNIHYVLKFKPGYLDGKDDAFLSNLLKLQTTISLSQLVLFDDTGKLHRYNSVIDILKDFFRVRLKKYEHRKRYLEALLAAEFLKIDSQVRFIDEKIRGVIVIENRKRKEMIVVLKAGKYPSDPVKAFFLREGMNRMQQEQTGEVFAENTNENQGENAVETQEDDANDYEYLLGMPLWSLTYERQEKLKEARKKKEDEYEALKKKTPHKLWEDDLDSLTAALDKLDEEEIKLKTTIKKKTNVKKIKTPIRTRDIDCQQVLEGKKIGGLVAVKALNEGNDNEDPLTEDDPLRKETQKQLFKKVTKVPKEPKVKGEKKPKGEKERKPKAEKGEKKERKPKSEKGEKKEKKPKASKKEKSEDGSSVSEKISEKKAPVKRTKAPQESTEKKAKKSKKLDTTDEITIRSESEMENVDPAPGIKAVRAKAVTKKYVESDPESEEKTFTPDSDVFAISDED